MYQILEDLNKTSGINGSLIVGRDGIVIAAETKPWVLRRLPL
jgi:predicted regulator of Ras-like GTPase activity (Roadblock/LC7/MglB family)